MEKTLAKPHSPKCAIPRRGSIQSERTAWSASELEGSGKKEHGFFEVTYRYSISLLRSLSRTHVTGVPELHVSLLLHPVL